MWDAAFETLACLGPPVDKEHAIDSTIVRAHPASTFAPVVPGRQIGTKASTTSLVVRAASMRRRRFAPQRPRHDAALELLGQKGI